MSETVLDSATISGTASDNGTFGKDREADVAILKVIGDSNSTDLTIDVVGADVKANGTAVSTNAGVSVSNLDASANHTTQITGLEGVGLVEISVTNNTTNTTTITVEDHTA